MQEEGEADGDDEDDGNGDGGGEARDGFVLVLDFDFGLVHGLEEDAGAFDLAAAGGGVGDEDADGGVLVVVCGKGEGGFFGHEFPHAERGGDEVGVPDGDGVAVFGGVFVVEGDCDGGVARKVGWVPGYWRGIGLGTVVERGSEGGKTYFGRSDLFVLRSIPGHLAGCRMARMESRHQPLDNVLSSTLRSFLPQPCSFPSSTRV